MNEKPNNDFTGKYTWKSSKAICCYENGYYHCEDGPAIVYPNGDKWYYVKGELLSEQEFLEWKLKNFLK